MARKRRSPAEPARPKLNVEPDEIIEGKDAPKPDAPAKSKKGLGDKEFEDLVSLLAQDATNFIDENIAQIRERATNYYKGRLPDVDADNTEEDRSRAVLSTVRDTVLGMMPNVLRVMLGSDCPVEYKPVPESDVSKFQQRTLEAQQATSYVRNVVLKVDNPDVFMDFYAVFQDALVRKTGVMTWYWDKAKRVEISSHSGLNEEQATMLASDEDVEVLGKHIELHKDAVLGSFQTYDLQIKRVVTRGKVTVKGVPCENVLVNRGATKVGDATLFGYTEEQPLSFFTARGHSAAELKDCDRDPRDKESMETQARQPVRGAITVTTENPKDESSRPIRYGRLYIRSDKDGDGVAELYLVTTAGTKFKVLDVEPVDEAPFATFCPYPEGYTLIGDSVADLTEDVQRISSRIMRDVLDSLAQSVIPQTSVLEGAVNLDDVLNPDTSRVIRTRQIGAVQPHVIPFVGKEALPVLDLMGGIVERRTGMSDASQGLDPKLLQSTDKDAVHATLSGAQGRLEMVCRVFAETGMAQLFRGILKLIVKHQDEPRCVDIGGSWVTVDPRDWNAGMHCDVSLAFGRGDVPSQIAFLMQVLAKQEGLLQELGPDNPFVTLAQYRYTLAKILELQGWKNTENFFLDPSKDPNAAQKIQQSQQAKQQPAPAGPDPQIEMAKIASHEKIEQMKESFKLHYETLKIHAQFQLKAMELHATHGAAVDVEKLRADAKAASDHVSASTDIIIQKMKDTAERHRHTEGLASKERVADKQAKQKDNVSAQD